MSLTISKSRFKPKSLEYFRRVEQNGEELIITDHGKPVAKILPFFLDPEKLLQQFRGTVLKFDDPTEPVAVENWEMLQ